MPLSLRCFTASITLDTLWLPLFLLIFFFMPRFTYDAYFFVADAMPDTMMARYARLLADAIRHVVADYYFSLFSCLLMFDFRRHAFFFAFRLSFMPAADALFA